MKIFETSCLIMFCIYIMAEFVTWGGVNLNVSEWDMLERAGLVVLFILVLAYSWAWSDLMWGDND